MFTTKNGQTTRKPAASRESSAVTILTSGCHFTGKMYCRGASRIGGRIDGEIISEGLLVIEEEAVIAAEIKAEEVVIQGQVSGKLTASGRVELCATANYSGDIITPQLVIREGALFNGRATMERQDEQKNSRTPRIISKGGVRLEDKSGGSPGVRPDGQAQRTPDISLTNPG